MTPITTSHFVELELILAAEFARGTPYIEAGHQTIDDDELDNINIEDIKLNGVSILPNGAGLTNSEEAGGFATAIHNLVANLLLALGDSVNEPLFAQADKDAE